MNAILTNHPKPAHSPTVRYIRFSKAGKMKKKKLVGLVLFSISVLYIIICLNTIDVDEDIMSLE